MMFIHRSNKETVTLIWFDPTIDLLNQPTWRDLNDHFSVYTDLHRCHSFIQSIVNEKIFLITSGPCASSVLSQIGDRIDRLFILSPEREKYLYLLGTSPRIVGVFGTRKELEKGLEKHLHLTHKQVERFNFYDQHGKGARNISEKTAEFLW